MNSSNAQSKAVIQDHKYTCSSPALVLFSTVGQNILQTPPDSGGWNSSSSGAQKFGLAAPFLTHAVISMQRHRLRINCVVGMCV